MSERNLVEVIWITGGGGGIGRAIAGSFSRLGYRVAISGRDRTALEEAGSSIALSTGGSVFIETCDAASEASVANAHAAIVAHFGGPITMLINCAGLSPFTTFSETSVEEFDKVIQTNLQGAFLVTKAVLPPMYEAHRGTIVQLLSIASEKAFKGGAAYVASKFALRGFTDSLREEARKHGVRVIGVLPGATETEIWDAESRMKYHERMMQPADIADMLVAAMLLPERALVEEIRMRPIGGDL